MEARASSALLYNIFAPWPDNPLHDGAVVIRNSWIRQAAAVLPLAMGRLASNLGTRHRAAVGITEETDALAIVVSEQRGTIGLAVAGRLRLGLNSEQLRVELLARLTSPRSGRWLWLRGLARRFEGKDARKRPPTEEVIAHAMREQVSDPDKEDRR